jgi:hypothetical protein
MDLTELREHLNTVERKIQECKGGLTVLKGKELEYQGHIERMARGEPKPGARRLEEDFDPVIMASELKRFQGNIEQYSEALCTLTAKQQELQFKIGGIITGGLPNGRVC